MHKQAVADAKSSPTSFWTRRRGDAKGEFEAARAKAAAARQEARNTAEKMEIIHRQIRRHQSTMDKAYNKAETAYHEIVAAAERQREAREQY